MAQPAVREPIGTVLTAEEYEALPDNPQRELVDGVIRVGATPTARHQHLAGELRRRLDAMTSSRFRVVGPVEIRLGAVHRRSPDVVAVRADTYGATRTRYLPAAVLLAIEVVCPGSETDDRREKPFEYAEAGIPYYWRVEPEPELVVHTYRLHLGAYAGTGEFGVGDNIVVPGLEWAVVKVSDLDG